MTNQLHDNTGRVVGSAAEPTLTLGNLDHADEAIYMVRVSNSHGSVESDRTATLTVFDPVNITTAPAPQSVNVISNAVFSVVVTGTSAQYQWSKDGT